MSMFDLDLNSKIDRDEFETLATAVTTDSIIWSSGDIPSGNASDNGTSTGTNNGDNRTFTFNPDTLECKIYDGSTEQVVGNVECCSRSGSDSSLGGACPYEGVDATMHMSIFTSCDQNFDGLLSYDETKGCYDGICTMMTLADAESDCAAIRGEELAAYYDSNND
jgi:hypothetical protein